MKCVFYRWRLLQAVAVNGTLSERLSRHVRSCSNCRDYLTTLRGQTAALRKADAASDAALIPASLHEGIMAAVRRDRAEPAPLAFPSDATWVSRHVIRAAAAVLIALLGVYGVFMHGAVRNVRPVGTYAVAASEWSVCEEQLRAVADAVPVLAISPMERELDLFRDDVRRTADFLLAQLD